MKRILELMNEQTALLLEMAYKLHLISQNERSQEMILHKRDEHNRFGDVSLLEKHKQSLMEEHGRGHKLFERNAAEIANLLSKLEAKAS